MDIVFCNRKLEKICNNQTQLIRNFGPQCATLISRRLADFREAENLEVFLFLQNMRCHELKGDRKGTLAVDLKHPYRLIFEVANDPVPRHSDSGLDWARVTIVRVLDVEDYHD